MRVLLVGFALPQQMFEDVLRAERLLPVQTHRFGWALVSALCSAGAEVSLVSAAPVTDYPHNRQLLFAPRDFVVDDVQGSTVPFVNVLAVKHVTRFLASRRAVRRRLRDGPVDAVVVHGINSALLWRGVREARRLSVPCVVVMTDPPSLATEVDNALSTRLKRLDSRLIRRGVAACSGVVALTGALAEDFGEGRPHVVMEGIARDVTPAGRIEPALDGGRTRVVYAGGWHEGYGVRELLDAVALSSGDWELVLYGRGELAGLVAERAASDDRVVDGGVLLPDEIPAAYAAADVLVNPRDPADDFTRYSFPSKILEYLASGTAVVSTRLSGIPEDYDEVLLWTEPGAAGLARGLDDAVATGGAALRRLGLDGARFALERKGVAAQGRLIRSFVERLSPA